MLKKLSIAAVGLGLLIGCTQMMEQRAASITVPEVAPGASYVGNDTCIECHEEYTNDPNNVHRRIASFEAYGYRHGCEACHGPGSAHVDAEGDTDVILTFGEDGLGPDEVAGVCTTCHQSGEQMHWASSEHAFNDVTCTDCHNVHYNSEHYLLKEKSIDLCVSCHSNQKARMYSISHHPLREGYMTCDSCHAPHGNATGAAGMLKTEERVNDLCLECHARYQGPFVYEHAPVAESCLECHDPHGTVANNLLKQNEPFLCLQCHEGHFHGMRTGVVGQLQDTFGNSAINIDGSNGGGGSTAPGSNVGDLNIEGRDSHDWAQGFLTKCSTCHQQVHGSDLPSQVQRLHGTGLTR
ncbi:MAG: GSU2203 family decaheme c-type cytochrome [Thermodesulfobacteriota bacterium]|nr:GSU2203 family decaheme c-type cytochrome [Thermodesulfobacteriota bacterium]